MKLRHLVGVLGLALVLAPASFAQTAYPERPIRIVVAYPPGGATDLLARQVAAKLGPLLAQTVLVENKPGASGMIGADYVAKAAPDGHTLLMGMAAIPIVTAFGKAPFDVTTAFAPVSTLVATQNLLVVRPGLPIHDVRELLAYAKAHPGKLTFGSSGIATPLITFEMLKSMTGIELVNVPYKGDAPAITDVISGQIDLYASTVAPFIGHVKAGKVRALGVTGVKRTASMPDIPTIAESGVPGFDLTSWYGILAPAGTPAEIVHKLNDALVKIVAMPEMQRQIVDAGADPYTTTPAEFSTLIRSDVAKYTRLVKDLDLKAE